MRYIGKDTVLSTAETSCIEAVRACAEAFIWGEENRGHAHSALMQMEQAALALGFTRGQIALARCGEDWRLTTDEDEVEAAASISWPHFVGVR